MKLLFDQNLSPKLTVLLKDLYPNSQHLYTLGLAEVDDRMVWNYARDNDLIVVSKDADYSDLSVLLGHPPKAIWIRRGNCQTNDIAEILRVYYNDIQALAGDKERGIITLF